MTATASRSPAASSPAGPAPEQGALDDRTLKGAITWSQLAALAPDQLVHAKLQVLLLLPRCLPVSSDLQLRQQQQQEQTGKRAREEEQHDLQQQQQQQQQHDTRDKVEGQQQSSKKRRPHQGLLQTTPVLHIFSSPTAQREQTDVSVAEVPPQQQGEPFQDQQQQQQQQQQKRQEQETARVARGQKVSARLERKAAAEAVAAVAAAEAAEQGKAGAGALILYTGYLNCPP